MVRRLFFSLCIVTSSMVWAGSPVHAEERPSTIEVAPGFDEQHEGLAALEVDQARLDLSKESMRARISRDHGVRLDAGDVAFRGKFTRKHDVSEGEQLLVVDREDGEIAIYTGTSRTVRHRGVTFLSDREREALGVDRWAVPVSIVPDGTLQLLTWRRVERGEGSEKTVSYHVTVFKAIGEFMGAPLDRAVATRRDDAIVATATLEPQRKREHIQFFYTPLGSDGRPLEDQRLTLRWNAWEGVFRHPRPVHAGPRRDTSS